MSTPFASAHADLTPLGYTVLPLIAPTAPHGGRGKAPGNYRGGWQGMTSWQKHRDESPSNFALKAWMAAPDANAGIVCGTASRDGLRVVALDFDAEDPDALDTLLGAAPASPMVKRGRKGETRFYLAAKTMKTASYDGPDGRLLDRLTGFDTRQTVVPPSIHPDTMQPYVWTAGPVAAADLPVLTDEDIEALEEALETCGWVRGGKAANRTPRPRPETAPDDQWSSVKEAAMCSLSAWVPALDLYDCRPARGGYEAVATWRASSTGRRIEERKRNLSVSPGGIKDFGTNDTYSAIDLVMHALDLSEGAALEWLEDRLGLSAPDVVIDLKRPAPWGDESDLPPPLRGLSPTAASRSPAAAAQEITTPEPVRAPAEMPAHLLDPPGLLGALMDYVTGSARKPQRVLALATGLTVLGTCAGRRYAGPTGSGTHLYALACAKSGAGKDHGLDMAARLLTSADMTHHIGKGEWMSFQAVYRSLSQQPLTLNPIDELGGFLRRINKRTSGGNEQAITAVLRTAWGKSFKMLPPPGWAGQDMAPVWSPALSILGASTHDDFFKAIEAGDTDNGFLNRWLLFSTQERPAVQKPTADVFEVPETIVEGMKAIYQSSNPLVNATMHSVRCDRPEIVARWFDGEDGALNREYLAWAESLDEVSDVESFFARSAEQAIRLATIRAIGCDPKDPVIDRECFEWAKAVSLWCANRMLLDAREFMAENQTQSDRAKVVRAIRANSPLTHRDLLRKLTTFKTRELDEIVKGLEAAELIRSEPGPPAANNKRSKIYTWLGEQ